MGNVSTASAEFRLGLQESTFTGRGGGRTGPPAGTATALSTNEGRVCPVCPNMVIRAPGESGWWGGGRLQPFGRCMPTCQPASWEIGYCWLLSMKCSLAELQLASPPCGNYFVPLRPTILCVDDLAAGTLMFDVKVWKFLKVFSQATFECSLARHQTGHSSLGWDDMSWHLIQEQAPKRFLSSNTTWHPQPQPAWPFKSTNRLTLVYPTTY